MTVSDVRSAESLAKEIPALLEEGIMVEAGGHGLLDLPPPGPDRGEPRRASGYARTGAGARASACPVIGELELAARFLKGRILAITGSNGKTTTTALAGEILKEAGFPTLVAGNIGVPVVGLIEESTDRHLVGAGGFELPA